jgi:L-lysine exporter family protein LysE/ArgO
MRILNFTTSGMLRTVDSVLAPLLAGLGLGLSLIVAIGAQNLFVLRQGVRREHVGAVVAVCALSDAVLIALGVSGIGLALQAVPWLIDVARWAGAAFLVGYGVLAARRALRPTGAALEATDAGPSGSGASPDRGSVRTRSGLAAAVATSLALTWLNPHVYLDTVFLLGSVAATHGDGRWAFACGAIVASLAWFTGLGFGARYLGRWLATPRAWRILDGVIAVIMFAIAASLVIPH